MLKSERMLASDFIEIEESRAGDAHLEPFLACLAGRVGHVPACVERNDLCARRGFKVAQLLRRHEKRCLRFRSDRAGHLADDSVLDEGVGARKARGALQEGHPVAELTCQRRVV